MTRPIALGIAAAALLSWSSVTSAHAQALGYAYWSYLLGAGTNSHTSAGYGIYRDRLGFGNATVTRPSGQFLRTR